MTMAPRGWLLLGLVALVCGVGTWFVWHSVLTSIVVALVSVPVLVIVLVLVALGGWMDSGSH